MARRRVVITGFGMITPLGKTVEENWEKILAGESGIRKITFFDPSLYECQVVGEVRDFSPEKDLVGVFERKEFKKMDRFIHLSLFAAKEAISDAGLQLEKLDKTRIGVCMGVGGMGLIRLSEEIKTLLDRGPTRVNPFTIPAIISNLAAGQISIAFGLKGFNLSLSTACASGAHAIGEGMISIQRGESDIVLTGGAEAPIVPVIVAGFQNMRALSTEWNDEPQRASRPFDISRGGFVLAEGAAILVLEESRHALKRDAKIYAELAGFARNSDANHITNPNVDGPKRCMLLAIKDAGIRPEQIGHINAHATSTVSGDKNETGAIKETFGKRADEIPVSATKSITGHLIGAAGAAEAIYAILSLKHGIIPPTINLDNQDPECDLNCADIARITELEVVLSNSFGFGGQNACLVFKKFQ